MIESTAAQQKAELRRLFASRMPKKLRQLLELWQLQASQGWTPASLADFIEHCERVKLSAANFEFSAVESVLHEVATLYSLVQGGHPEPGEAQLQALQSSLRQLAEQLEGPDGHAGAPAQPAMLSATDEQALILAIGDPALNEELCRQLSYFGYRARGVADAQALSDAVDEQTPAALVAELALPGIAEAIAKVQDARSTHLPCVLLGGDDDLDSRLAAVRAGGDAYFEQPLSLSVLIQRLDELTTLASPEPYRIMVVEDSRAQAKHADIVLKSVGFASHVVTEPLLLMEALVAFHPELILMDMQMPDVSGVELARVLRQHPAYQSIPIVFLSAEDDAQKRLTALTVAGDDFLTKPLRADQLVEAVTNRAQRARANRAQQAADPLTHLLNRQHFMNALEVEVSRASRTSTPLALAVLDIDALGAINSRFGQHVGDHVLQTLSRLLSQRLRKTDPIGRIGDDRLGLILPNCNAANAVSLLTQLCRQFASLPHRGMDGDTQARFSGGLALLDDFAVGPLMGAAESALGEAKRQGGNRIVLAGAHA
ncbi:MAG: diguanylate cyclase [Gammaproteobacteria bacterium]|nr:diguanylate cyclase [Gammaproteobacteria bacterium]